jgi:hypothetical protein
MDSMSSYVLGCSIALKLPPPSVVSIIAFSVTVEGYTNCYDNDKKIRKDWKERVLYHLI